MATATKKTTTKKTAAKKATKKAAAKKTTKKKKSASSKNVSAKERQDAAAKRPIKWSDSRIAVVKTLKQMKAFDPLKGRKASEIAAKSTLSGLDAKKVKIHCDVYRGNELVRHGIVASEKHEGSRELVYYLTAQGRKLDVAKLGK